MGLISGGELRSHIACGMAKIFFLTSSPFWTYKKHQNWLKICIYYMVEKAADSLSVFFFQILTHKLLLISSDCNPITKILYKNYNVTFWIKKNAKGLLINICYFYWFYMISIYLPKYWVCIKIDNNSITFVNLINSIIYTCHWNWSYKSIFINENKLLVNPIFSFSWYRWFKWKYYLSDKEDAMGPRNMTTASKIMFSEEETKLLKLFSNVSVMQTLCLGYMM